MYVEIYGWKRRTKNYWNRSENRMSEKSWWKSRAQRNRSKIYYQRNHSFGNQFLRKWKQTRRKLRLLRRIKRNYSTGSCCFYVTSVWWREFREIRRISVNWKVSAISSELFEKKKNCAIPYFLAGRGNFVWNVIKFFGNVDKTFPIIPENFSAIFINFLRIILSIISRNFPYVPPYFLLDIEFANVFIIELFRMFPF